MNDLSHEEFLNQCREKIVSLSKSVIKNEITMLEAARQIDAVSREMDLDDGDEIIQTFSAIVSETDDLPTSKESIKWSEDTLRKLEPKIKKAEEWARLFGITTCKRIITRFGGIAD